MGNYVVIGRFDYSTNAKILSLREALETRGEHKDTAILCLNPSHSKLFVDFYYGFHERYEEYCTGIGYYNSIVHGNPIFHATIAKVDIINCKKQWN